jgi:hypothetical protein
LVFDLRFWRPAAGTFVSASYDQSKNPNPKSKMGSALLLLVAWILADHTHDILALDDLAAFAKPLDGCSDFHGYFISDGG